MLSVLVSSGRTEKTVIRHVKYTFRPPHRLPIKRAYHKIFSYLFCNQYIIYLPGHLPSKRNLVIPIFYNNKQKYIWLLTLTFVNFRSFFSQTYEFIESLACKTLHTSTVYTIKYFSYENLKLFITFLSEWSCLTCIRHY